MKKYLLENVENSFSELSILTFSRGLRPDLLVTYTFGLCIFYLICDKILATALQWISEILILNFSDLLITRMKICFP